MLHVRAFLRTFRSTMPSADFCRSIRPPLDDRSPQASRQISPGNAHSPSRLCPPHLHDDLPYRYRTLKVLAFSSDRHALYVVPVRRASVLPAASFRFHLAMDTLAVRLMLPPVGCTGDFHSQTNATCLAHEKKGLLRSKSNPCFSNQKNVNPLFCAEKPAVRCCFCRSSPHGC